jgi:hypothetical protein
VLVDHDMMELEIIVLLQMLLLVMEEQDGGIGEHLFVF